MSQLSRPAVALPALRQPGPGPLQAILAVLGYFALQLLLGLPLWPLMSWLHTHPSPATIAWQPDLLLWMTCLDLLLAGLISLYAARRWWPQAWHRGDAQGLGFVPPARRACLLGAVLGLAVIPLLSSGLTQWLAHGQPITEQIDGLIMGAGRWARLPIVLLTVSLVPLVEEMLFRGVLLSALRRQSPRALAVGLSSAAFAVAHLGSFAGQWYALPALCLFALTLAELRIRSGSIWPGVLAHACNNAVAMIAILSAPAGG